MPGRGAPAHGPEGEGVLFRACADLGSPLNREYAQGVEHPHHRARLARAVGPEGGAGLVPGLSRSGGIRRNSPLEALLARVRRT